MLNFGTSNRNRIEKPSEQAFNPQSESRGVMVSRRGFDF